jgi:hypothetical protein
MADYMLKLNGIVQSYAWLGKHPDVCSSGNNATRLFVVQIIIVQDDQTSYVCSMVINLASK